jgi:hypothetical protein
MAGCAGLLSLLVPACFGWSVSKPLARNGVRHTLLAERAAPGNYSIESIWIDGAPLLLNPDDAGQLIVTASSWGLRTKARAPVEATGEVSVRIRTHDPQQVLGPGRMTRNDVSRMNEVLVAAIEIVGTGPLVVSWEDPLR